MKELGNLELLLAVVGSTCKDWTGLSGFLDMYVQSF